ncbi:MAG: hypothetical protein N3G22_00655 [Candidatus Micrarchaeota archaeon]|nr:hypothetical protein [Candidatus Micrarchaeota archaeon]
MALRGQAASESMMIYAVALLIVIIAIVLAMIWPGFASSVEKERSDKYWSSARPIAVKSNFVSPNYLLLEIKNEEPQAITLTKVYVNGQNFSMFRVHEATRFSWDKGAPARSLYFYPNTVKIISINLSSLQKHPCKSGEVFLEGSRYQLDLAFSYRASSYPIYFGPEENQTGTVKLVGECIQEMPCFGEWCLPRGNCGEKTYYPPYACCNNETIYLPDTHVCCSYQVCNISCGCDSRCCEPN